MHYKFPIITDIEQVRKAIAGCDDFIEVDKGDYIVFNYLLHGPETFPPVKRMTLDIEADHSHFIATEYEDDNAAIRRECRGLIFGKDGKVLARRFHKFFNLEEKLETAYNKVDLTKPHMILEKLDGSMITPIVLEREPQHDRDWVEPTIWWGTKMGITDIALWQVHEFTDKNPQYNTFAKACWMVGGTPIFEWCSRKNRIVIDHPNDQLILTAIRNNEDGRYWTYKQLLFNGEQYDIPVVKAIQHWSHDSLNEIREYVREFDDKEGIVIRFDDGHMIKIKGDWYVKVHQAKDMLSDERKALTLILEEKLDDLLPILLDEDRERIVNYQKQFLEQLTTWVNMFYYLGKEWRSKYDRKAFAIDYVGKMKFPYNGILYFVFSCDNRKDIYDYFVRTIQATLGRRAKFEPLKQQFFSTIQYVEGTD